MDNFYTKLIHISHASVLMTFVVALQVVGYVNVQISITLR